MLLLLLEELEVELLLLLLVELLELLLQEGRWKGGGSECKRHSLDSPCVPVKCMTIGL